jgi:hypothetical protein
MISDLNDEFPEIACPKALPHPLPLECLEDTSVAVPNGVVNGVLVRHDARVKHLPQNSNTN